MKIAPSFSEEATPHALSALAAGPLWSTDVKRVDTSLQAYERLPADLASDVVIADVAPARRFTATFAEIKPSAMQIDRVEANAGEGLAEARAVAHADVAQRDTSLMILRTTAINPLVVDRVKHAWRLEDRQQPPQRRWLRLM